MSRVSQVPDREHLSTLPVEYSLGDEPWQVTVSARSGDGDAVEIAWDEQAASFSMRWSNGVRDLLTCSREGLFLITIGEGRTGIEIHAEFRSGGFSGVMFASVGDVVSIRDVMLRQ